MSHDCGPDERREMALWCFPIVCDLVAETYGRVIGARHASLRLVAFCHSQLWQAMLLDDPTAAIDAHTEDEILQAMENAMRGRTTFIIAHRLSSVVDADRILVIEDGRVREQGTHYELVDKGGIYAGMYREQFKSALAPSGA